MIERGAVFSGCGKYRYALWRSCVSLEPDEQGNPPWPARSVGERTLGWVMLNPSSAAEDDDPTIRKCMGFAKRGSYDGIMVVNLFAFKATMPRELWKRRADIVGPDNNDAIRQALSGVDDVMYAWGATTGAASPRLLKRSLEVSDIVLGMRPKIRTFTLGFTSAGFPRHPLYVPYTMEPRVLHARQAHAKSDHPWNAGGLPPGPPAWNAPRQLELGEGAVDR